ncbi:coatomer subunit beta [Trichinella spiralis]|uniref:coatomer subunit beta n=1 Tax=Trichinella spiralis TaxID=6334 RepID=UPI0001EFC4E6|nr:coatomer subunit beta [Trichinella spiralis]
MTEKGVAKNLHGKHTAMDSKAFLILDGLRSTLLGLCLVAAPHYLLDVILNYSALVYRCTNRTASTGTWPAFWVEFSSLTPTFVIAGSTRPTDRRILAFCSIDCLCASSFWVVRFIPSMLMSLGGEAPIGSASGCSQSGPCYQRGRSSENHIPPFMSIRFILKMKIKLNLTIDLLPYLFLEPLFPILLSSLNLNVT